MPVASNSSLDRSVSHRDSPMMLSQAVLGVGRCSRAVSPSSLWDLAPISLDQATAGVHVQIMGHWQAADPRVSLSASPLPKMFQRTCEMPQRCQWTCQNGEQKNRNDNVEPCRATWFHRQCEVEEVLPAVACSEICPPIAVMIRGVVVHA